MRAISKQGVTPLPDKIEKFLTNLKFPTSVKLLQRYVGSVNFYRQYIPRLAKKLMPLHQLLQKDINFQPNQVHKDAIFEINEHLAKAAKLYSRLLLPDQQPVTLCDANERAAGFVLLIEDYTSTNGEPHKAYARGVFGSRRFTTGPLSLTMYVKEFLATHFMFDEVGHIS